MINSLQASPEQLLEAAPKNHVERLELKAMHTWDEGVCTHQSVAHAHISHTAVCMLCTCYSNKAMKPDTDLTPERVTKLHYSNFTTEAS